MVFKYFSSIFASVLDVCFKCFICLFFLYVATIVFGYFKSRSGVAHEMHVATWEEAGGVDDVQGGVGDIQSGAGPGGPNNFWCF
jgi:hypothetical protein